MRAVVLTAISMGCARQPKTPVSAASPDRLGAGDATLLGELLEMADARRQDTALVDRGLAAGSRRVRAHAARAIGQVRMSSRAVALRALTSDLDSVIAADAAFSLGLLRDLDAVAALGQSLSGAPPVIDASAWSRLAGGAAERRPMSWYVDQVRAFAEPDFAGRRPRAIVVTTSGRIELDLYGADATPTVANFARLARRGYYNGLAFHRVVPNFVVQDGDPRGDGGGGPGYAIRDELNRHWYDRGALGMALSGPDTGGSQYFLTHSPQPHLDGHYTVFGHVTAGFDVLDALVQGDRIVTITIR